MGEDMVILVLASLLPLIAPLPMMAMAVFTSFLQAYVFVMLSTLYLAGAMAEEH
jgi:F-type H+-transporting ATPase subunit a